MAAKRKSTQLEQSRTDEVQSRRVPGRVVAVTGTCTFLGQNLIALLEEDPTVERVVAVDIKAPVSGKKTRFYEVDLTQPPAEARLAEIFAAEGVRSLVHLAFHSSPSHATA
ncbi:MAG TPA: NAD-dependent epimerase/dehydratase family protein, partial [Polyangiaceae bacterium]|nr:NAD-dependent epimerase/dehydratase family protein [Polyangiaceae bacterium]